MFQCRNVGAVLVQDDGPREVQIMLGKVQGRKVREEGNLGNFIPVLFVE